MKKLIACSCIAFFIGTILSRAQSPAEEPLYHQLTTGELDKATLSALDRVLKDSEEYSAVILYAACAVAMRTNRLEDAGFLFYAGQIRVKFDKAVFPPTGTGGNSPMLLFGALQYEVGTPLNPALFAKPKIFVKVAERIKSWKPKAGPKYEPGWEYSKRGDEKTVAEALESVRKTMTSEIVGQASLLLDTNYFAAFRIVQDYNLKSGATNQPSRQAYDTALGTMQRIEKQKGIDGAATAIKQLDEQRKSREESLKAFKTNSEDAVKK